MPNEMIPIATPVRVKETKEYSGDVQQMSSPHREVGYWTSSYAILDANADRVATGIESEDTANQIASAINNATLYREELVEAREAMGEQHDALQTLREFCGSLGLPLPGYVRGAVDFANEKYAAAIASISKVIGEK